MTALPPLTRETDLTPAQKSLARRSVAGAAIGNAIEWFDYGVYGYLATYIATLFFTFGSGSSSQPLILTFAVFAISFLIRPLGGIVLGPLGDKLGRRRVLIFTIAIITLSTTLIGVLPTYAQVGWIAPVLLVLLRMIQGFSAGGEYAGAAVFMSEHAPDNRRGAYGSFLEFGTLAGFSGAAILCTLLGLAVGEDGMLAGWWRLPFLLTLVLGVVAIWMRRRFEESDCFVEDSAHTHTNDSALRALGSLIVKYPAQVLKLVGVVILINVAFYLVLTYMPTYLNKSLGADATTGTFALVIIQLLMMAIINPLGRLSDRIGRKPLLIAASIGFIVFSLPAILLIQTGQLWADLIGIGLLGLFLVMTLCTISSTLPALFPTAVRYTGFAIGYNISTSLFGGTASLANEFLIDVTGNILVPGFYLTAAGIIGLISVLTFRETAGRSLRGNVVPGTDDHERLAAGETLVGMRRPA